MLLELKDELSKLTNLFSEEESEILKSHLYVRGYKAHIKQKAIYEIITKKKQGNPFAIHIQVHVTI